MSIFAFRLGFPPLHTLCRWLPGWFFPLTSHFYDIEPIERLLKACRKEWFHMKMVSCHLLSGLATLVSSYLLLCLPCIWFSVKTKLFVFCFVFCSVNGSYSTGVDSQLRASFTQVLTLTKLFPWKDTALSFFLLRYKQQLKMVHV
jgi:hypothetical protein